MFEVFVNFILFWMDGVGVGNDGCKDGVMVIVIMESGDVIFWDLNGGG